MPGPRLLPDSDAEGQLLDLVREIAASGASSRSRASTRQPPVPAGAVPAARRAGCSACPTRSGGVAARSPTRCTCRSLEELAAAWMTVAVGCRCTRCPCYPLATFGTEEQRPRWLPEMLAGGLLGAYALSEPHAGSDAAAMRTRAARTATSTSSPGPRPGSHTAGVADFYRSWSAPATTAAGGSAACWPTRPTPAWSASRPPERKMGLTGSTTASCGWTAPGQCRPADRAPRATA